MKRMSVTLWVSLVIVLVIGCAKENPSATTYVLETKEPEIVVAQPIEEDLLTKLRDEIQEEMFVFDVVEHHEAIYELVKGRVDKSMDDQALTAEITKVIQAYMDEQLDTRIDSGLREIQSDYNEDDANWVRETISTRALYNLITIYEREYYKSQNP